MKKTLISAIAAFCLIATSFASDFATIVLQTSNKDFGGYHGMRFALDADYESNSIHNFGNDLSTFVTGQQLLLDKVELTTRYVDIKSQQYVVDKTLKSTYITISDRGGAIIATSSKTSTKADKNRLNPATVSYAFDEKPVITVGTQYTIHFFETVDGVQDEFRAEIYLARDKQDKDKWGLLRHANNRYQIISTDCAPAVKIYTSQSSIPTTMIAMMITIFVLLIILIIVLITMRKRKQED